MMVMAIVVRWGSDLEEMMVWRVDRDKVLHVEVYGSGDGVPSMLPFIGRRMW